MSHQTIIHVPIRCEKLLDNNDGKQPLQCTSVHGWSAPFELGDDGVLRLVGEMPFEFNTGDPVAGDWKRDEDGWKCGPCIAPYDDPDVEDEPGSE
jgi:hypothetical protein